MIHYYIQEQNFRQFGEKSKRKRYLARLDEKTMLDTDELCRRVADRSTLAKGEMRLAMDMFCAMAEVALKEGRAVQLGNIGVIHPIAKSALCDKKEEVTIDTIKEINCTLRLSRELKKALNNEKLRKIKLPNQVFTEDND
ncbi:HU family DNA-binding protein [bacterium]|nr:HU family DNA-binding protein [bacterium]